MLASAARAQPVWDGATKPRVESSQGNLVFNAHADVTVNLAGRGAAGQGRSLWSLISHQDTSVASGCEIGQVGMAPSLPSASPSPACPHIIR